MSDEKTVTVLPSKDQLFENMLPETRAAAELGAKKLAGVQGVVVLVQYDIGTQIAKLLNSGLEGCDKETVQEQMEILGMFLYGKPARSTNLYDLRNVAISFTRAFVKAQVSVPMSDGSHLTWSHFKELQKIATDTDAGVASQLKVLTATRDNSWSANELRDQIKGTGAAKITRSGGRKPSVPKTLSAMLRKLSNLGNQTSNYIGEIRTEDSNKFLEELENLATEDVTEKFAENIENTEASLLATREQVQLALNDVKAAKKAAFAKIKEAKKAEKARQKLEAKASSPSIAAKKKASK
jgi:hypothetical protein